MSDVYLYSEPRCEGVDFLEISDYLRLHLPGIEVSLRGPFFDRALAGSDAAGSGDEVESDIAEVIAGTRVRRADQQRIPGAGMLTGEIEYERRRLGDGKSRAFGILYDAEILADGCMAFIKREETGIGHVHIIITNQLIGTWDSADNRYHARAVLCGSPSIVSTAGIAEAPAKDRSYYLVKRGGALMGLQEHQVEEIARDLAGDFITAEDLRMTEILKGYVMQAVAYRETGEPFCADGKCRLYNAHWQSEVLLSQLGGEHEYCEEHRELFEGSN